MHGVPEEGGLSIETVQKVELKVTNSSKKEKKNHQLPGIGKCVYVF
jgi:hypothetical protein